MHEHSTSERVDVGITLVLITTAVLVGIVARVLSLLVSAPTCTGT